jgi:hypothetical protein
MSAWRGHLIQLRIAAAEWSVGVEVASANARLLYTGVEALMQPILREHVHQWPPEWATDGLLGERFLHVAPCEFEAIGLCWILSIGSEHGKFPIRLLFGINDTNELTHCRLDLGELETNEQIRLFPATSLILFGENGEAQLLATRRQIPIAWTTVYDSSIL